MVLMSSMLASDPMTMDTMLSTIAVLSVDRPLANKYGKGEKEEGRGKGG